MLSTSAFPSVTEQQLSRTVVIGRTINPRVRTVLRRILPYLFVGVFPALGVTAVGSARIVPFVVLGVPPHVIAIVTVIVKVHSMFPHINTDVDSGPVLPRLIVTPETHRWHHLVDINRVGNYAATTVVWDHVFRTYRSPGLTPDTLFGIPASDGERVPEGWLQQLLAPWRNPKAVDAAASLS
jgi:sterol desaturase/sphingolipid hydroxylase (fatty acid hydroxylase superfamily)